MIGRTNSGSMSNATAALDFTVVDGLTEPVNPKEKMIWIATDEEITSWTFSATEPAAQQGLVWFQIGQSSSVAFSITKDNPIMVYPIKAQQYINNTWVEKITKIYLNGEWATWYNTTYWFKSGDGPINTWNTYQTTQAGWAGVSINSERIALIHDWVGTGYNQNSHTRIASKSAINLSNINTLYFQAARDVSAGNSSASASFGVASEINAEVTPVFVPNAVQELSANDLTLYEIDVSKLKGNFYLAVTAQGHGDGRIYIYNIYGI